MLVSIDYVIIGFYFVVTLAIGFWSARKGKESSKSFFVAEKSLPWWVVGFTMVAASISAEQMLGEVGYGFGSGLVVSNWDLAVYPSLLLMIFIFLPLYLRNGITTIPEYLEKRYDKTTRLLFAGYTVFNNTCITLVMVLALGATAIKYFTKTDTYDGLPVIWGAALLALFTGVYTVYGGMSSVAWTDTFQCILLLAGGLTIFFVGLSHVPPGVEHPTSWGGLFERMPNPHLIRPIKDDVVPWPGLLLLALSTNVWYCCTNQFYVQSCLGAKSEWHGRMGVLLTAFLGPILTLCFAFPGYIASDLVNQKLLDPIADANATYSLLVHKFLGPGLRGFLIAAVLGAIMSTVSSITNATASVFTMDIYKRWIRTEASDNHLVSIGRMTGFVTLLIAFPLTLLAARYSYIFIYSQNAWCILAIPIMLVFIYGALWKGATSKAANTTFLIIAPFVAVPFIWGNRKDSYLDFPFMQGRLHLFNFASLLWIAAAVFMYVVSLATRQRSAAEIDAYIWKPKMARGIEFGVSRPWYQGIGYWSVIAALIYIAIYRTYW